ncbi:MAG TPA: RNase adapter RapZ [Firmicutes bacterium]|nr:RNase adapter RapZ [Bacillota bacterium]
MEKKEIRAGNELVIITGLSGAGKSLAVRSLEDLGFFCVDNLPPALVPKFAELLQDGKLDRVALVIDIRGGEFFAQVLPALQHLETVSIPYQILFLEASDEVLVRRYKETRRRHPLAPQGGILEGIEEERRRLSELRGKAHVILDTSDLTPQKLREEVMQLFGGRRGRGLIVVLTTFGYKHGIPLDADLVFDVRFLPNPNYVESLRAYDGTDERVAEYVLKWPVTRKFLKRLEGLVRFLLPLYLAEGKTQLTIAVGCTGGRHRSVVVAEYLAGVVRQLGHTVLVEHRDVGPTGPGD